MLNSPFSNATQLYNCIKIERTNLQLHEANVFENPFYSEIFEVSSPTMKRKTTRSLAKNATSQTFEQYGIIVFLNMRKKIEIKKNIFLLIV